ncbi:hypothetical protein D3C87_687600 [compost metagenome]
MRYANKRAEALALMREHIRDEIKAGRRPVLCLYEAELSIEAIKQEAMVEFDMPGVRYWHMAEDDSYWATMPGEKLPTHGTGLIANLVIELTRNEFIGRQKIHSTYAKDRI